MSEPQVVLFVCTGNYYRSRYAELYFNGRVPPGASWLAESRGFAPTPRNPGAISPTVPARLAVAGLQMPSEVRMPLLLGEDDLRRASAIIALDADEHLPYVEALFPSWRDSFRYWRIADLGGMSIDEALSAIDRAVDRLLQELLPHSPDLDIP